MRSYKKGRKSRLARCAAAWLVSLGLWSFATLAEAAASEAPRPPSVMADASLSLVGSGDFDVLFWDVYTAALWSPDGEYSPQRPHALAIRYERDFEGGAIAERSIREIKQLGMGSTAQHRQWLDVMKSLFPDVSAGDQLTGVHYPGEKAVFYRNETRIGSVADAEFAKAFFSIWLDRETSAPGLRQQLLGMADTAGESESESTP